MDFQRLQNRLASLRTLAAQLPDGGVIKPQMVGIIGLLLADLAGDGVESLDAVSGQSPAWRIGYQAGLGHAASLRLIEATQARVATEEAAAADAPSSPIGMQLRPEAPAVPFDGLDLLGSVNVVTAGPEPSAVISDPVSKIVILSWPERRSVIVGGP